MAKGWNADDNQFLEEHFGTWTNAEIGAALGRSPHAVLCRAQRMELNRPVRALTPYIRLDMETQLHNWPYPLSEGISRVARKILPRIQRRLGTLVEYGDVFNASYLWMCQNPYYNMRALEGRMLRMYSDRGINDGATWMGGQSRLDLGATWGPDAAVGKDDEDG